MIKHSYMNHNNLYTSINQLTDSNLWLYIKFGIYMSMIISSLHMCINQYTNISLETDFSIHLKLKMYIKISIGTITIN